MTERNRTRSLWTLVYLNGILPMRTQPLYLINTLASPLSFLFFIFIFTQGKLVGYGIAGGMVLTILAIGTSLQTDMTHYKQDLKFQDLLVASPVEAPTYVGGLAISEFVFSIPSMAVFVGLSFWGHVPYTLADGFTIVGVLLLVGAFSTALGFTLATYFADIRETFAVSPLISIILTVLPPVYYPPSYLPAKIHWLAYISPTSYAADLVHGAFHLEAGLAPSWVDWLVLFAFTVGLFALASAKARWREP